MSRGRPPVRQLMGVFFFIFVPLSGVAEVILSLFDRKGWWWLHMLMGLLLLALPLGGLAAVTRGEKAATTADESP